MGQQARELGFMGTTTVKAFVSHASEDHVFAEKLARTLIENGIDAWYDGWEIHDGDSLVQRIFDEGIGQADVVIVVLSQASVQKAWVRRELNVSVVRQIQENIRLVPVLIDLEDAEVPVALRDTKWRRIRDVSHPEADLEGLLMSIYGYSNKPALGQPPAYVQGRDETIQGMTPLDSQVLKIACEMVLNSDRNHVLVDQLRDKVKELGIGPEKCREAIDELCGEHYIELPTLGYREISVRWHGLEQYLWAYRGQDYRRITQRVKLLIANRQMWDDRDLAAELGEPVVFIDHVLENLDSLGYIRTTLDNSGMHVYEVRPKLNRELEADSG